MKSVHYIWQIPSWIQKGKKYRTQTRGTSNKLIGSDVYEHLEDNESATGTRSSDGSASNKIGQLICVKID